MSINTFTPNTKIESAKVNANFTNFSNHGRNFTLKWAVRGSLSVSTVDDYLGLPDNATIERIDIVVGTGPTGAAIIVDVEVSTDSGGSWASIVTSGNRPQIAASGRAGNTTTISNTNVVANSSLYRIKIAQIGSTIPGANLSVLVKGKYNLD